MAWGKVIIGRGWPSAASLLPPGSPWASPWLATAWDRPQEVIATGTDRASLVALVQRCGYDVLVRVEGPDGVPHHEIEGSGGKWAF